MNETIAYMSASELLTRYTSRELSPVEVTRAILERIEQVNPTVNAFVTVTAELALEQAERAERAYANERPARAPGGSAILDQRPHADARHPHGARVADRSRTGCQRRTRRSSSASMPPVV